METWEEPYVSVLLNGHRFGCVSKQRAVWLIDQDFSALRATTQGLSLTLSDITSGLESINRICAHVGALDGWRGEPIDVLDWSGVLCLGQMERAAARFWGSHTRAVHLNAWVRCDDGHGFRLWLAKRADSKSTDPGRWDNLVAGGLAPQESPLQALRREALEEASLDLTRAHQLTFGPTLKMDRAVAQGWQRESLFVVDAQLPMDFQPVNQDGEVQAFGLFDEAGARELATANQMTADAAAATLDFLKRQG